jgi:hypothetical protein
VRYLPWPCRASPSFATDLIEELTRFAAYPIDTHICHASQTICQLGCVVLKMAKIHKLVFQLGHFVPREA